MLSVVAAVAKEVIGAGHALGARARARAHEAGPAHVHLLPSEAMTRPLAGMNASTSNDVALELDLEPMAIHLPLSAVDLHVSMSEDVVA